MQLDVPIMELIRAVYISSAGPELTGDELNRLVEHAREANLARGITGLLLHNDGSIIQVLEGPADEVDPLLDRISRDSRHSGMVQLMREPMEARDFEDWSMGIIEGGELSGSDRDLLVRGVESVAGNDGGSRAETLLRAFARQAR